MNIVDLFDLAYTSVSSKKSLSNTLKIGSAQRFLVRNLANLLIPVYYLITRNSIKKLVSSDKIGNRIIISLTSFPPRISRVWVVIESLLRQSYRPDIIVLWLSKEQFKRIDILPKKLLKLQKYGLQIYIKDDDLRSYKKFIYTLRDYPKDILVTVDDDIVYPTFMLKKLIELHKKYPQAICCHRALLMRSDKEGALLPYSEWTLLKKFYGPSNEIFQTSGGGTLYPPKSLHQEVYNVNLFKNICFTADDIWLNAMSQMQGVQIVKSDYYSHCLPIINRNNSTLSYINNQMKQNDNQLKAVRDYFLNSKDGGDRVPFCYTLAFQVKEENKWHLK